MEKLVKLALLLTTVLLAVLTFRVFSTPENTASTGRFQAVVLQTGHGAGDLHQLSSNLVILDTVRGRIYVRSGETITVGEHEVSAFKYQAQVAWAE